MFDPYAAIRHLPLIRHDRPIIERRLIKAGYCYDRGDSTECVDDVFGNVVIGHDPYFTLATDFLSPDQRPFQAKYNEAQALADGTVAVTLQQPGAHKYDTMLGIYQIQGAAELIDSPPSMEDINIPMHTYRVTGLLVNDPMTLKTRQESTAHQNWEDIGTAVAVLGSVYAAGTVLSNVAAGGAAAGAAPAAATPASALAPVTSTIPTVNAGALLNTARSVVQAGTLLNQGLSLVNAYQQTREMRDGAPATSARGETQWVDETGFIFTRLPDGSTRTELPPVGVAFTLPDGRVVVNNGDGTFAIVDQLGNVVIRNYPASAGGVSGAAGGGLGAIGETLKRLSVGEWVAIASLIAMLTR